MLKNGGMDAIIVVFITFAFCVAIFLPPLIAILWIRKTKLAYWKMMASAVSGLSVRRLPLFEYWAAKFGWLTAEQLRDAREKDDDPNYIPLDHD